ncbi:5-carboxymethyl-2-hydroxymuconate delta isomerase [Streptomyces sp. SID5785]|uniref:5-carboxymethyl-2-hydroxymuconate Delta-isomerase n=1 Tax=Streptomyces sp. SID5785 TaxID=2690309 RepID=UPI001F25D209|nr:5-carboxymethyl-2-hydroxymuconate delta isomerase [Streptomyces sp. SID5785]
MPHITVDYSPRLGGAFDRPAFATALHTLVVEAAGSQGTCKVFFRAASETYVMGGEDPAIPVVHVEVALLPGRSEGTLTRLSQRALRLLRSFVVPDAVCSVEVRQLDAYSLDPTRLSPAAPGARAVTARGRRCEAAAAAEPRDGVLVRRPRC